MNVNVINTLYEKNIKMGYKVSLMFCKGGYPNQEDCSWYHGNWMLLRYLGMVSNPFWHENFYLKALHQALAEKKDNVLVVGTADFSMPFLCSSVGIQELDICDICRTPLEVCDKVSREFGYKWNTFQHDMNKPLKKKYSVIINDAFLSRFERKENMLERIADGLEEGGYYITTLKEGKVNKGGEIEEQLKNTFIEKAVNKYNMSSISDWNMPIKNIASEYVEKMSSYPVKDENEIEILFKNVNLGLVYLEKDKVPGEYEPSEYFRIIAKKIKK